VARKKLPTTLEIHRRNGGFFPLLHSIIRSPEYRSLSNSAKLVLQSICSGYNGKNGTENDPIICPYKNMLISGRTSIAKAIRCLEADGWIGVETNGGLMNNPNKYRFGPTLRKFYK